MVGTKKSLRYSCGVFGVLSVLAASANAQSFDLGGSTWVGPQSRRVVSTDRYAVREDFDDATYVRRDYIKRPGEKRWNLFYTHGRGIEVTIGHKGRLVLINDFSATKACKVMISDLETHKQWEIDQLAREQYERDTRPDSRLVILPIAQGFSPDDKQVLIKMDLNYIRVATGDSVVCLGGTFKPFWYAVDLPNGKVRREFQKSKMPDRWWAH